MDTQVTVILNSGININVVAQPVINVAAGNPDISVASLQNWINDNFLPLGTNTDFQIISGQLCIWDVGVSGFVPIILNSGQFSAGNSI